MRIEKRRLPLFLAWVAGTIYFILWAPRALDLADEGFGAACAVRVLSGEVPHRDFFSLWPPGAHLLTALLFKVGGVSFLWGRIVVAAAGSLTLALALSLSFNLTRSFWLAALTGAIFVAWGPPMFNLMQPGWLAAGIGLLSAAFAITSLDKPSYKKFFWGGLTVGVVALFKHNVAVYLAVAWLGLIIYTANATEMRVGKGLAFFLGALSLAVVPVLAWLVASGAGGAAFHDLVAFPLRRHRVSMAIGQPWPSGPELVALLGVTAFCVGIALERWRNRLVVAGAAVAVAAPLALLAGPTKVAAGTWTWAFHLPWVGFAVAGALAAFFYRGKRRALLAFSLLFLLALHLQIFPRADRAHLAFSLASTTLIWAAVLGQGAWLGKWKRAAFGAVSGLLLVAMLPAAAWQLSQFVELKSSLEAKRVIFDVRERFPSVRAPFVVKAEEGRDVRYTVNCVDRLLTDDEPLVVVPVEATLLVLSGHDFPGRYSIFLPGYLDENDQLAEIALWEGKGLRVIVTSTTEIGGHNFYDYCPILGEYISDNFKPLATYGRFTVNLRGQEA